jgi:hypothetical protein
MLQLCTFHRPADGCRSGIVACSVCRLPARDLQRNRHDSRRSRAMTSIDLAARDASAATEDVALRLQRCCRETSSDALGPILSDRNFAKDRAETAASRTPTALWQDKSRSLFAGRSAADGRKINDLARGAFLSGGLHFWKTAAKSMLLAPRVKSRIGDGALFVESLGLSADSASRGVSGAKRFTQTDQPHAPRPTVALLSCRPLVGWSLPRCQAVATFPLAPF